MSFAKDLELRLRASYPCIYVVAREDWRCTQEVKKVAEGLAMPYRVWTVTSGWSDTQGDSTDPLDAIKSIRGKEGVYALINFHRFLEDNEMIQLIKDTVQIGKGVGQTLVFICNVYKVPDELQDDVTRIEFSLPDKDLLRERLDYAVESIDGIPELDEEQKDAVVEAALGMTTWEAENAMVLSAVESGRIDFKIVAREKAQAVSKSGILEFYAPDVDMKDVGGLDNLKAWLSQRRNGFSKEAREFGLPDPKGILLVGVPGCGKSLSAKAIASEWSLPLIRFDLGKLFQGLVGASEENVRKAIATAEAVAPVVLWIDEIEKGMAGATGSGQTDSGVTARVFGTLISWLQERQRPVFVVATANQVWNLPPELMRAGRWDEVFAVDLPGEGEREEILAIHLRRRHRNPDDFKMQYIVKESAQFSGAELEAIVVKGLFQAFSQNRELVTEDLMDAIHATVPLAITRKEDIDALRAWASTRAIPASTAKPPEISEADTKKTRKVRMDVTIREEDEKGSE